MSLKSVSPQAARQLLDAGAVLGDIRGADEYAREHIRGARHLSLDQLNAAGPELVGSKAVIFHCRGGQRTRMNEARLAGCVSCEAYMLEGGIDAWKAEGLEVEKDPAQPLELQRQVMIAAGSLVLLGVLLGYALSPWLFLLSGFVGAGLIFAGISGFCGMALLLQRMPWNRRLNQP